MWQSLLKLRKLPGETHLFCGHEYTQANIRFAQTIEQDNLALIARAAEVSEQVSQRRPTIPTTLDSEKAANPFLRADVPEVAAGIGMAGKPATEVFAEIRARKNKF
jgi:hydroxyacylglutathione hydrolase